MLEQLQKNLSKLDVVDMAYRILDDMSDFIADLNRKRLSETGKDSNDNELQQYSPFTVTIKSLFGTGIGAITSHTTLYSTGDYQQSIFASVISASLIVDATDSKTSELESKYPDNLGLTDKEQDLVRVEFWKRFEVQFYAIF